MLKAFIVLVIFLVILPVSAQETPYITIGETNVCAEHPEGYIFTFEAESQFSQMFYGYQASGAGASVTISAPSVSSISIIDFGDRNIFAEPVAQVDGSLLTHTFDDFMSFAFWLVLDNSDETIEVTISCDTSAEPAAAVVPVTDGNVTYSDNGRNSFVLPPTWSLFDQRTDGIDNAEIIQVDGTNAVMVFFYPLDTDEAPKKFPADKVDVELAEFASGLFVFAFNTTVSQVNIEPLPFAPDNGRYLTAKSGTQNAGAALLRYSDESAVVVVGLSASPTLIEDILAFVESVQIGPAEEITASVEETAEEAQPRIVFVTEEQQIATVITDGSDLQILTDSGEYLWPRWSPDGHQIAYLDGETKNLVVMNPDGSDPVVVGTCEWYFCSGPSWSPDGTRLAYTASDAMQSLSIEIITLADGSVQTITPTFFGFTYTRPEWSPDGRQIAFTYIDGGRESLGILDVANRQARQTRFGDETGLFRNGIRWTEDSRNVILGFGWEGEIYLINPASNQRETRAVPFESSGAVDRYFPDGSIRVREGNTTFVTYDPAGEVISTVELAGRNADWQPDVPQQVVVDPSAVVCEVVFGQTSNTRTGPGTNYDIARVAANERVQAVGQARDGSGNTWWQLADGAWVRNDVVAEDGDCNALPITTP